jgi:hypothetical protein
MELNELMQQISLPQHTAALLKKAKKVTVATTLEELSALALSDERGGIHTVAYDVQGKGLVVEAHVCRVKNGIAANYVEPYMRRRDPNSMLIGDDLPTDKMTFEKKFGRPFTSLREETFDWLESQEIAVFLFRAGQLDIDMYGLAIAPANAGFFCLGLGILQGIIDPKTIKAGTKAKCVLYTAPPFRHSHFEGKQVVVHERGENIHEIFSYNLYPGPSAKKGVYSALLDFGEREGWVTAHASVVQVVTPYGNKINLMHEGASGGGKSEMHEHIHREYDGTITLGRNVVTGESLSMTLPRGCDLKPVADDMAICHASLQKNDGFLNVYDGEAGWFIRVDHIKNYGTDPDIESLSIHPKEPLLFLNIDAFPNSTALLWEHTEDEPGKPCPNPRFLVPREIVPNVISRPVSVHVRSFGTRMPPCTKEHPSYGIMGMFHIIPPSLAWLWRLVSPRGYANPSILETESGMSSEGVGSYWPFATGRRVAQANLLLQQIKSNTRVHYVLCPNQHVGAWKVSFNPQWIMREYLARRGGVKFMKDELAVSRCSLLGYSLNRLVVEGQDIEKYLLKVELQGEVGTEAYDAGASQLLEFFHRELKLFYDEKDLDPLGKKIIEACFRGASLDEYESLIESESIFIED